MGALNLNVDSRLGWEMKKHKFIIESLEAKKLNNYYHHYA